MSDETGTHLIRTQSLGYQVNHLARLLARALRDRIAEHGVVPGQFPTLLALYEHDGLTQTELCLRVRIEQPTMANTLNRMERDGLVRRVPDPVDARRMRVVLTPEARRREPALVAAARAANADATRGLSQQEVTTFMATLAHVIDNLEAAETTDAAGTEG